MNTRGIYYIYECAKLSHSFSVGVILTCPNSNQEDSTELCVYISDDVCGARGKEYSGRNASEGIEPRNVYNS